MRYNKRNAKRIIKGYTYSFSFLIVSSSFFSVCVQSFDALASFLFSSGILFSPSTQGSFLHDDHFLDYLLQLFHHCSMSYTLMLTEHHPSPSIFFCPRHKPSTWCCKENDMDDNLPLLNSWKISRNDYKENDLVPKPCWILERSLEKVAKRMIWMIIISCWILESHHETITKRNDLVPKPCWILERSLEKVAKRMIWMIIIPCWILERYLETITKRMI